METWQLQEAKNKFSELVEHALHDGPQMVTRHGKPAVVVMSAAEFEASQSGKKPKMDFKEFLLSMPKSGDDEDLFVRVDGHMRDIDFE